VIPIEPLFAVAALPGEYAGGIGVTLGGAIATLWRRVVALETQRRLDEQAHFESTGKMYEAAIAKKDAELDYLRKKQAP